MTKPIPAGGERKRPARSLAALAQGYLDNTYPFLPILPEDLSTLITYLGSATSHLQLAVATMVWPHAPLTLPHLDLLAGDSIADVQAAIFFTYASYGRAEYGNARIFLAWVGARCLANGWNLVDSPQAPPRTPVDREHIRRIFYEAWGLEVILSMQTGVRAFVLQPEPFEVDVPEPFATESSPNGLKIRALSLVAAASEPPSPSSAPAASLDSVAAICASIGLLGHQAYHTASTIVDRESAFQATMLASAALIHVVAASYASSGFTCGLDPTVKPTPHSRELITTSSNMIFSTLRESLAPHLPRTLHSPFWGCALLGASHGLLLALNTDDGTADGDSGMADEGDEWRRSALVMHLEIADWVLTEHSTMWPSVARVAQDVKTLRSVFLGDILSDDANLIMSSFPDSIMSAPPAAEPIVPDVPSELSDDGPPTPTSVEEKLESFGALRDERHFEETKRRAQLVMGPPLGGNENETVIPGEEVAENEAILREFPDEAEDLELTHLRIKTLRGLGLERFKGVERISLRQNLLSSLAYTPLPPAPEPNGHELTTTTETEPNDAPAAAPADEVDEDDGDDEDAKKKEEEFEWAEHHSRPSEDVVWPLRDLVKLEELDLYDNRLKSVKGLEGLVSIKSLDLSFNLLRSIRELEDDSPNSPFAYPHLDHLYLIQNKLSKIEGVRHRTGLDYLELGGNRIRTIENLPISATLRSLYLGKNKITKMDGLAGLTGLRTLSIQSNRITKIEGLETLVALEELYLSHNGLTDISGLSKNVNLTTLDIANNKITKVPESELATLTLLEELWANNNEIDTLPILPPSSHPSLETLYLEGNPIQATLATAYRRKIQLEMPQLKQIDAVFVRQS
ncbi:hypothetical protein RQP46_003861 [Phenoliferia psychrophenolica]